MQFEARLLATIDVGNILGEGVLWRAFDKTIWWVDIEGCRLHCLSWPSRDLKTYKTPGRVGSFSFITGDPDRLLIACENRLGIFTPATEAVKWLAKPLEPVEANVRLNDGRTDPAGRFWVGTMAEDSPEGGIMPGKLYRIEPDGGAQSVLGNLQISNGLCWSPGGDAIYLADSPRGKVFRAPYDLNYGVPGMFELFSTFAGESPDGAVTDTAGIYWTALWGGSRVAGLGVAGDEIASLNLPVSQPSCVGFAGDDMNLLCVTSAKAGLSENELKKQPLAGSLFIYQTNIVGIEPTGFRFDGT